MILLETLSLPNGLPIHKIGLGTWLVSDRDAQQAVKDAVKIGYRHFDSAQAYQNENGVGKGVRECGVKREELFVTSKVAAEIKSHKEAAASIDKSLQRLGLDYIDLMLIHSPRPWGRFHSAELYAEGNREVWRAFEEAYEAGKLRSIGISNFEKPDIDNILGSCTVKPMVNQILVHVGNTPSELIRYSREKGMLVEAYSPVAHGELLKNKNVKKIAEKYGVSIAQLSIRFTLQLDLISLPKTTNTDHMKDNADVDFEISEGDMEFLKNLDRIKDYGNSGVFPVFRRKSEL